VAAFWYPVVPSPVIKTWEQAELLLTVGSKFDIQLVLHKVDLYLKSRAALMVSGPDSNFNSVWQWMGLDGQTRQALLSAYPSWLTKQCSLTGLAVRTGRAWKGCQVPCCWKWLWHSPATAGGCLAQP
jgi:hypothetical protein